MKFSLNFLKQFFDPQIKPSEVADRLTMAGLEIEKISKQEDDFIFDAEVTPNRYDWLSIFGIAYELAALSQQKLDFKFPEAIKQPKLKQLGINLQDKQDCSFYSAAVIQKIKVKDSSSKIKDILINSGVNPVNNIVDITNYCMLKWGNPLHAFDADKIEGDISIRRAKEGEQFVGLDGKQRELTSNNLVISDQEKVIALAGVMGAKNSEVGLDTKNIVLEGAVFSPITIRRSRRDVGLETDSSYRFERNVSPVLLGYAFTDALNLIKEGTRGKLAGYKKVGSCEEKTQAPVEFKLSSLNCYLGTTLSLAQVQRILISLGFQVKEVGKNNIQAIPPFFRLDIQRKVDVFEEIARIYGYNNIPEKLPQLNSNVKTDALYYFKKKLSKFLVNLGLWEIITYSINNQQALMRLDNKTPIELENPLRQQENALRTTALASFLEVAAHNFNQKNEILQFFELADVYFINEQHQFKEKPQVIMLVSEAAGGFFQLKGLVQKMAQFIADDDHCFKQTNLPHFDNALTLKINNDEVGFIGLLNNDLQKHYNLAQKINFAQFDLAALCKLQTKKQFCPFSRFPFISRDISLSLSNKTPFELIGNTVSEIVGDKLLNYKIVDIYRGKNKPKDKRVFSLRVYYCSPQRTLTSQEVDKIHFNLRSQLSQLAGVELR